jgi:hypothetical protein
MGKAVNVTKFDAGGSGDNIISDGYINSVEKVWIDSFTVENATWSVTNATIEIAKVPPNKKITSVDVILTTAGAATGGSISIGFSTDSAVGSLLEKTALTANITSTTIRIPGTLVQLATATSSTLTLSRVAALPFVTGGTQTTVAIKLYDVHGSRSTGTIRSVVRWT